MALFLHIDTSTDHASVALSDDKKVITTEYCTEQKEHASFVQPAIRQILQKTDTLFTSIAAISVTIGPGSYTGLRVGLASAKGLCFAGNIPLLTLSSTLVMAAAGRKHFREVSPDVESFHLCPMIDARRMEVFFAVYDEHLQTKADPAAWILDPVNMPDIFSEQKICFFGNGSQKWKSICQLPSAIFLDVSWDARDMADLAYNAYLNKQFASVERQSPMYVKEFQSSSSL